jgi:DNA polymerase III subunit delta'
MEIIGHQKQLHILHKSIESHKLAQAYLFSGPQNVGKFSVALDFANKITEGKNPESNPNLVIIRPEEAVALENKKKPKSSKREIKIDQIRELQRKLSLFSGNKKYQIAIIDEAERLNKQAQNALLKTLEEPNDSSLIILVANNTQKLLPTIISRCQKIKFGPVSLVEIEKWLESGAFLMPNASEKEKIIFWSLGRPGLIFKLAADKNALDYREETLAELKKIFKQNLAENFLLLEEMSKDKEEVIRKLNLWIIVLRQTLLGQNLLALEPMRALKSLEAITASLAILRETNSNTRLILENLLLQM